VIGEGRRGFGPLTGDFPAPVLEWIARFGSVPPDGDAGALTAGGLRALRAAITRPGRDREGAFALLAADGLLTLAMERLADVDDPERALFELLECISGESGIDRTDAEAG
jgi:hypothetical protein